jgi:hypothetical protein
MYFNDLEHYIIWIWQIWHGMWVAFINGTTPPPSKCWLRVWRGNKLQARTLWSAIMLHTCVYLSLPPHATRWYASPPLWSMTSGYDLWFTAGTKALYWFWTPDKSNHFSSMIQTYWPMVNIDQHSVIETACSWWTWRKSREKTPSPQHGLPEFYLVYNTGRR